MLLDVDLPAVGGVATALAALLASYAVIQSRRTERSSANQEATQQAFDLQGKMLDRVQTENEKLRARVEELHGKVNTILAKQAVDAAAHRAQLQAITDQHHTCEQRLAAAEERLAALGGA